MSMSAFSINGEIPLPPGFSRMAVVPFFDPVVMIFDKKEAGGISSIKLGVNEPKKGVYVIVETEPSWGRYNVTVGLGGVDGEKQTLLNRVKYHDYRPPSVMKDWDKAILISDWEDDIRNRAKEFGDVKQKSQNKKITEAMRSEVHLIEKMLHAELMKFNEGLGSLRVLRNHSSNFTHFMPNPDNERYNYYVRIVMEALRELVPNYDKLPKRKQSKAKRRQIKDFIAKKLLDVGETVRGSFDSEAEIIDESGKAKVTTFNIKNKKATKKDLSELQNKSLFGAASAILKANGRTGNISAPKFWYVIRNNELVAIEDLKES